MTKIAEAIAYAHVEGVIHRDLKPGNVLLDRAGVPRVTDFGLAKRVEAEGSGLTVTGQVVGTPGYMPPEQAGGDTQRVGQRADVYSLGAVLYCLLTGRPPFQAATAVETLIQVMAREPVSPRQLNSAVPRDLETIVLKCLEKEQSGRYASAQALADELQRYLDGKPIQAWPIGAPARGWRWCRRNSALASTIAFAACLLVVISCVYITNLVTKNIQLTAAVYSETLAKENAETQRKRAETNEQQARNEKARADEKADEAETAAKQALAEKIRADASADQARAEALNVRRHLYAANMNQAQAAWENADIMRLRQLLKSQEPAADSLDLRGWEWRFYDRLVNAKGLRLQVPSDRNMELQHAVFHPDGRRLSGATDTVQNVYTWDANTGAVLSMRPIPLVRGTWRQLSADGRWLAVLFKSSFQHAPNTSFDITVWDVASGELRHTLKQVGRVTAASFDEKGERLIVAIAEDDLGAPQIVRIFQLDTDDPPVELKGDLLVQGVYGGKRKVDGLFVHRGYVRFVAFSPDGRRVLTIGNDSHKARVWHSVSGESLYSLQLEAGPIRALAFRPDGAQMATVLADATIRVWDCERGGLVKILTGHTREVTCVAFSSDGQQLVTGGIDRTVRVWNLASGKLRATIKGWEAAIRDVAFQESGDVVALDDQGYLYVGDPSRDLDQTAQTLQFDGLSGWQLRLAFDAAGRQLSAVGPHVRTWDVQTGEQVRQLQPESTTGRSVAVSADGSQYAWVEHQEKALIVCSTETNEQLRKIPTAHTDAIIDVTFSPDGRYIATAGQDGKLNVFPLDGGDPIPLTGFTGALLHVLFTPDCRHLILCGQDPAILVWDLATKTERRLRPPKLNNAVNGISLTRDGGTLAAISAKEMFLWNVEKGELLSRFYTGYAKSVAFHPDGARLAMANESDGVKVWDRHTGQEVFAIPGDSLNFNQVAFSPDGTKLAASTTNGTMKIWDATPVSDNQRRPPTEEKKPTGVIKIIEQRKMIQRVPLDPAKSGKAEK